MISFVMKPTRWTFVDRSSKPVKVFLSGNVINLSKYSFTKGQYNSLNKNFNFCATSRY